MIVKQEEQIEALSGILAQQMLEPNYKVRNDACMRYQQSACTRTRTALVPDCTCISHATLVVNEHNHNQSRPHLISSASPLPPLLLPLPHPSTPTLLHSSTSSPSLHLHPSSPSLLYPSTPSFLHSFLYFTLNSFTSPLFHPSSPSLLHFFPSFTPPLYHSFL